MTNLKEDLLNDAIWWLDDKAADIGAPDDVYMIRKKFGWGRDAYDNSIKYADTSPDAPEAQECLFNLLIIEAINESN